MAYDPTEYSIAEQEKINNLLAEGKTIEQAINEIRAERNRLDTRGLTHLEKRLELTKTLLDRYTEQAETVRGLVMMRQQQIEYEQVLQQTLAAQVKAGKLTTEQYYQLNKASERRQALEEQILEFQGKFLASTQEGVAAAKNLGTALAGAFKAFDGPNIVGHMQDFAKAMQGGQAAALSFASSSIFGIIGSFINNIFGMVLGLANMELAFEKNTGATQEFSREVSNAYWELAEFGVSQEEASKSAQALFSNVSDYTMMIGSQRTALIKATATLVNYGVAEQDLTKSIQIQTKMFGLQGAALQKANADIFTTAQALGRVPAELQAEFAQSGAALAKFGDQGMQTFKDLARTAKITGYNIDKLLALTEKFDTFEGAATQAGKLNAALGGNFVNAMDLMMTTDPVERFNMLRDSILNTGMTFDTMSYYQRKFYADAMGLADVGELSLVLSGNSDMLAGSTHKTAKEYERLAKESLSVQSIGEQWNAALAKNSKEIIEIFDNMGVWIDRLKDLPQYFDGLIDKLTTIAFGFGLAALSAMLLALWLGNTAHNAMNATIATAGHAEAISLHLGAEKADSAALIENNAALGLNDTALAANSGVLKSHTMAGVNASTSAWRLNTGAIRANISALTAHATAGLTPHLTAMEAHITAALGVSTTAWGVNTKAIAANEVVLGTHASTALPANVTALGAHATAGLKASDAAWLVNDGSIARNEGLLVTHGAALVTHGNALKLHATAGLVPSDAAWLVNDGSIIRNQGLLVTHGVALATHATALAEHGAVASAPTGVAGMASQGPILTTHAGVLATHGTALGTHSAALLASDGAWVSNTAVIAANDAAIIANDAVRVTNGIVLAENAFALEGNALAIGANTAALALNDGALTTNDIARVAQSAVLAKNVIALKASDVALGINLTALNLNATAAGAAATAHGALATAIGSVAAGAVPAAGALQGMVVVEGEQTVVASGAAAPTQALAWATWQLGAAALGILGGIALAARGLAEFAKAIGQTGNTSAAAVIGIGLFLGAMVALISVLAGLSAGPQAALTWAAIGILTAIGVAALMIGGGIKMATDGLGGFAKSLATLFTNMPSLDQLTELGVAMDLLAIAMTPDAEEFPLVDALTSLASVDLSSTTSQVKQLVAAVNQTTVDEALAFSTAMNSLKTAAIAAQAAPEGASTESKRGDQALKVSIVANIILDSAQTQSLIETGATSVTAKIVQQFIGR